MPKAEKGTPKDIANRIKAKGLQKLKFYCQMCQKQCRDANGFKCHMTSETHIQNMRIFAGNASGIMDTMSKDFEKNYLDTLRRRHGTKRVNANNVYQEVIQDRHHIHMNSTKWATLSIFVQYLGRTGKCVVDETERGWYVQYIERDAGILARQEALLRRQEAEKAAEQRYAKQMKIQREEAAKAIDKLGGSLESETTALQRAEEGEKVAVAMNTLKKPKIKSLNNNSVFGSDQDDEDSDDEGSSQSNKISSRFTVNSNSVKGQNERKSNKRQKNDNEDKVSRKKSKPSKTLRSENWLSRNILVRIISKKLADGAYYKRKGVVDRVLKDKFTAEIEVLDSRQGEGDGGDILRLDQDDLETVIPKEGKQVKILNGEGRGEMAWVISLNPKRYKATLKLEDGSLLERVDYEDFSKLVI